MPHSASISRAPASDPSAGASPASLPLHGHLDYDSVMFEWADQPTIWGNEVQNMSHSTLLNRRAALGLVAGGALALPSLARA